MLRKLLGWGMAAVLLCGLATGAENPLRKAEIGDWAEFTMEVEIDAGIKMNQTGTSRTILAARDGDEVVVVVNEVNLEIMGGPQGPQRTKTTIDTSGEYDPIAELMSNMPEGIDFAATGEGKETLEVPAGKYDCEWKSFRASLNDEGVNLVGDIKIWTSATAPLVGHVQLEITMEVEADGMKFANKTKQVLVKTGKGAVVENLDQIPDTADLMLEEDVVEFDVDFEDEDDEE